MRPPIESVTVKLRFPDDVKFSHVRHHAQLLLDRAQVLATWLSTGYPEKPTEEELQDLLLDIGEQLGNVAATLSAPEGLPVTRQQILTRAASAYEDRGQTYGEASEGLARASLMWTAILGTDVTSHEVALCMAALKMTRIAVSHDHLDSWLDATAYMAMGAELAGCKEEP